MICLFCPISHPPYKIMSSCCGRARGERGVAQKGKSPSPGSAGEPGEPGRQRRKKDHPAANANPAANDGTKENPEAVGNKKQVFHGKAKKTPGGLRKADIRKSYTGSGYISIKMPEEQ